MARRSLGLAPEPTFDEPLPWWDDDTEPNADMWATADESRGQIVGLYHRAWAHSDGRSGVVEDYRSRLERVAQEAGQS